MDIKAYILSGKLELFVLGELSEREREEVVMLSKQYPEIKQELDQIEEAIFAFDDKTGVKPSSNVKKRIFDTMDKTSSKETPKNIQSPKETKTVGLLPWKAYAAAASIIAVIASVFAIYFANRYYDVDEQLTAMVEERSVLAQELEQYKVNFEQADTQLETLLAGNYERVPMSGEGFETQKDALVDVWWDREASSVFISVNNLSELDESNDYQLWAIGDDGPVGIGLVNPNQKFSLQQMQRVAAAGAFAITIEPKGGSESPNLDRLVVLGEVA